MSNLTTKELSALEDQLGYEQVAVKKFKTLAGQCSDAAIQSRLETIAGQHQQHFNTLVNYLK